MRVMPCTRSIRVQAQCGGECPSVARSVPDEHLLCLPLHRKRLTSLLEVKIAGSVYLNLGRPTQEDKQFSEESFCLI